MCARVFIHLIVFPFVFNSTCDLFCSFYLFAFCFFVFALFYFAVIYTAIFWVRVIEKSTHDAKHKLLKTASFRHNAHRLLTLSSRFCVIVMDFAGFFLFPFWFFFSCFSFRLRTRDEAIVQEALCIVLDICQYSRLFRSMSTPKHEIKLLNRSLAST